MSITQQLRKEFSDELKTAVEIGDAAELDRLKEEFFWTAGKIFLLLETSRKTWEKTVRTNSRHETARA
jgi:hypothetical protein